MLTIFLIWGFMADLFASLSPSCLVPLASESETVLCAMCSGEYYNSKPSEFQSFKNENCILKSSSSPISESTSYVLSRPSNINSELLNNLQTKYKIYTSLMDALRGEDLDSRQYIFGKKINIKILLGTHFVLDSDLSNFSPFLFERNPVELSVEPLYCSEAPADLGALCLEKETKSKIFIKTEKLNFFISNKMSFKNLNFDAIDVPLLFNNDPCKDETKVCCQEVRQGCTFSKNTFYFWEEANAIGLFNIEPVFDLPGSPPLPSLSLANCLFSNFLVGTSGMVDSSAHLPSALIVLYTSGGTVKAVETAFENCFFAGALLYKKSGLRKIYETANNNAFSSFNFGSAFLDVLISKCSINSYNKKNYNIVELNGVSVSTLSSVFLLRDIVGQFTVESTNIFSASLPKQQFLLIKNSKAEQLGKILLNSNSIRDGVFKKLASAEDNYLRSSLSIVFSANLFDSSSVEVLLEQKHIKQSIFSGQFSGSFMLPSDTLIRTSYSNLYILDSSFTNLSALRQEYCLIREASVYAVTVETIFTTPKRKSGIYYTNDTTEIRNCKLISSSALLFNAPSPIFRLTVDSCLFENLNLRIHRYKPLIDILPEGLFTLSNTIVKNYTSESQVFYLRCFLNASLANVSIQGFTLFNSDVFRLSSSSFGDRWEHQLNITNFNATSVHFTMTPENLGKLFVCVFCVWSVESNKGVAVLLINITLINVHINYNNIKHHAMRFDNVYLQAKNIFGSNLSNFIFLTHSPKTANSDIYVDQLQLINNESKPLIRLFDFGVSAFTRAEVSNSYFFCDNLTFNTAGGFNLAQTLVLLNVTFDLFQESGTLLFSQTTFASTFSGTGIKIKSRPGSKASLFTLQTEQQDKKIPWVNSSEIEKMFSNGSFASFGLINCLFESSNNGAIVLLVQSQILVFNCTFKNLISSEGSVIRLTLNSKAAFYNCYISKSSASSFGGALFIEGSLLVAIGVQLEQVESKVTGGVVNAVDSEIVIIRGYFIFCSSPIGGTIFSDNSKVSVKGTSFLNSVSEKYGAHIVAKQGILNVEGSLFKFGKALNLGASFYLEGTEFSVKQTEFLQCQARIGIIYSVNGNEDKTSFFENVRFSGNKVSGSGTIIYSSDFNIKVNVVEVSNNEASAGFLFVLFGSFFTPQVSIRSLRMSKNKVAHGIFALLYAQLVLQYAFIEDNELMMDSFWTIKDSSLTLQYTYFSLSSPANELVFEDLNNYVIKGRFSNVSIFSSSIKMRYNFGFLNCFSCLSVTTSLSSFNEGSGERGGVLMLMRSVLKSDNCLFSNNLASQGGAIYSTSTVMTLDYNIFFKNEADLEGSDILVGNEDNNEAISLTIFNSLFNYILKISTKVTNINIQINKTAFYGFTGYECQALVILNTRSINISHSEFSNFFNNSAVLIISNGPGGGSYIQISFTNFNDSKSLHTPGAFIRTIGSTTMKISDSNFTGGYSIRGGAIYFSCRTESCPLQLSEIFFRNNIANEMGGALSSESLNVTDSNSKYIGNDAPVGSDTNFFPTKLALFVSSGKVNLSREMMISYLKQGPNDNCSLITNRTLEAIPGYEFTFGVVVMDKNDNIQYAENNFMARINVRGIQNDSGNNHVFTNNLAEIRNGSGIFNGVILVGGTHKNVSAVVNYYNGKHSINENITVIARGCIRGDSYLDRRCLPCPEHFYSLNPYPESNNQSCHKCPEYSYCPGGDMIVPYENYWRKDSNSSLVLPCKSKDGCPNQNISLIRSVYFQYQCAAGYEGNMCEGCSLGYGNVKNQCLECSSTRPVFIFFIVSGFFIYLIYVYIQEKKSMKQATDEGIALMKILLNHISVFVMLSAIKVNWSQYFKDFFTITSTYASTSPSTVFSFDCLFEWTPDEKLVNTLLISGFIPILINILCFVTNLVINFIMHLLKKKIHEFMDFHQYLGLHLRKKWLFYEFNKHMTIIFFNIYPQVLLAMFKTYGCKVLDDTDDRYLVQFPWVLCNSSFHKNTWSISIFFILLYGLIGPILISLTVWRGFKRDRENNEKAVKKPQTLFENFEIEIAENPRKKLEILEIELSNVNKMIILNFATRGYRSRYFWWEITVFSRKILFLCIATFSEEMDNISIGGMTMYLLTFYLLLTLWFKPYVSERLNLLETSSILVSIASIAMGLITSMGDDVGYILKIICSIILMVINIAFIGAWFILYSNRLANKFLPTIKNKIHTKIESGVMKLKAKKAANEPPKQVQIDVSKRR